MGDITVSHRNVYLVDSGMARTTWEPTPEQKKLFARYRRSLIRTRASQAEQYRLLAECDEAGIPVAHLAAATGVERKTIYRQLERPVE